MAKQINFAHQSVPPKASEAQVIGVLDFAAVKKDHSGIDEKHLAEVLELISCIMGAKATVAGELSELVNSPSGIPVLRNLLVLAEILGKLKLDSLSGFARELDSIDVNRIAQQPPSLWQLFRSARHPDVRRGLGLLLRTTEALGRATR